MKTEYPSPHHMPQQRAIWQEAFGDTDAFLDSFFRTAYSPDRCLCVLDGDRIAAILYWIDCELKGQTLAYIYAVVTDPSYRGRGLCRMLMEETHALLKKRHYSGAILVPQKESLRKMYAGMGYRNAGGLTEFSCSAAGLPVSLQAIGPAEFAARRKDLIPADGILQEGCGLAFLAEQLQFYAGRDFLLAAFAEKDVLHGVELLGRRDAAPGILQALGCPKGHFRMPGNEKPFSMFHPLSDDAIVPEYLGFAFD